MSKLVEQFIKGKLYAKVYCQGYFDIFFPLESTSGQQSVKCKHIILYYEKQGYYSLGTAFRNPEDNSDNGSYFYRRVTDADLIKVFRNWAKSGSHLPFENFLESLQRNNFLNDASIEEFSRIKRIATRFAS
ncbi:hypothetical protein A2V49_00705 [candidate division WWE3 bacterium RBG_19FT_COMBO_34_6]|uniref:Uncharacterized protein n=1 Tax=candidate division WWE3 bacterium RBG_19FT_COMBO_34_6 TaxID=1802612 RepID=A0A1F4UK76_UNCKA|nr:MAG: hypothetical protein A2V49_00705 [candidate division WWE3 bacterium RBG_19FT_COMBO_34_6]